VREEAIYSRGRLAGGWSAGRQVVCLRHNRTGRTCDSTTAIDKFTAAIADMNKEQQLMRELMEREIESQAESNESFPKQALLAIRREFPLLVEILTYYISQC
jgi:hypothetical protein